MTGARNTRRWHGRAVTVLFVFVVVAGCGASGGDATRSTAGPVTPAPVPDAPTDTDGELLPGVTRAGVVDPVRLVDAHVETLSQTTYTVRRTERRTAFDGAVRSRFDHVVEVGADDRYHYVLDIDRRTTDGVEHSRIERWVGDGRAVVAETVNNRTEYRRLDTSPAVLSDTATNRQGFVRLFTYLDLRVTDRTERAGVTHFRLAVENGSQELSPLRDVTFDAWVSERGVVREYNLSYLVPTQGGTRRVTANGSVSMLGTTTAPPPPEGVLPRTTDSTPAQNASGNRLAVGVSLGALPRVARSQRSTPGRDHSRG